MPEMKVGDLVTGEFFQGEKRLTYVDALSVMVQITPAYEQAYFPHQVQRVEPQPETCRPCGGTVVRGDLKPKDDLALCLKHWNWWVIRFLGADDVPCDAHLIPEPNDSDPKETR